MQATPRGRTAYELTLAKLATPPIPPPPPVRRNVNANPAGHAAHELDPKWLEDAVLRILKKHAPEALTPEIEILTEDFFVPPPSRFWRVVRASVVVILLLGAGGAVAWWRYPAKTAAVVARTKAAAVWIGPPSSWLRGLRAQTSIAPAPIADAPIAPVSIAPSGLTTSTSIASPVAPAPPFPPASEVTASASSTPAPAIASPSLPPASTVDVAAPPPRTDAKHVPAAPRHPAVAAPVTETPKAPPPVVETPKAAPPAVPVPGSLGDAIKRASVAGKVPTIGEHSLAAPSKPAPDAALPDRPSASLVTSALLAALPDARACMNDGDDAKQAVVLFDSSGAVSSVQVSGASASCIQKALSHARVAPFSQPTYRAVVPVRPN